MLQRPPVTVRARPSPGFSCRDKKRLKEKLKDAGGGKIQGNLQIRHAVCHQKVGGAEKASSSGRRKTVPTASRRRPITAAVSSSMEKSSLASRSFPSPIFFCAQSAAAGSDHNAAGNRQGDERIYGCSERTARRSPGAAIRKCRPRWYRAT